MSFWESLAPLALTGAGAVIGGPVGAAAGGAVGGAMMGQARQRRQQQIEDAERKLAAETQRYSWITGNKAGPITRASSAFDTIGQGALLGGMQGAQLGSAFKSMGSTASAPASTGSSGGSYLDVDTQSAFSPNDSLAKYQAPDWRAMAQQQQPPVMGGNYLAVNRMKMNPYGGY